MAGFAALDINKVTFRFGPIQALDGVTMTLEAGSLLALLGPNGAGKTTLLNCMLGLLTPFSGDMRLFGYRPGSLPARRMTGVMLQNSGVPELLSTVELVELFRSYHADPIDREEIIKLAGIESLAHRRFGTLSGGQKQQVLFALAIVGRPRLLLLDEPTNGMDMEARARLWRTVKTMRDDGTAVLLTTHYVEEADRLADEVILLDRGAVLAQGSPALIKSRLSGSEVRFRSMLPAEQVNGLCAAEALERNGDRYCLMSAEPETLLRRLLSADPNLTELEIRPVSLEHALSSITEEKAA